MTNQNLGQLIITGISGLTLTQDESSFIGSNNIGGIILFKHNYSDPAQLAELVNSIQALRGEYPLFISVDQEGGRVRRFQTHFTQFPPMMEIGKIDSPKLTFELHKVTAKELASCGVNLNYSPCCDILTNPKNNVIGDRAFGRDVDTVQKHVSAAIRGLHAGGVLACAKHFPGHGSTTKDSHFDLPYVKTSMSDLENKELIPFIKASKSRVEFMMMAHLVVDSIDPDLPCSLSKKAYDYLRDKIRFNRVVITDDMEMKAIVDHHSIEKSAVMAINAGADVLCYRSMSAAQIALSALQEAYTKQELKKADIGEKLKRISTCKEKYFADYKPIYVPDMDTLFNACGGQEILDQIYPPEKPIIVSG